MITEEDGDINDNQIDAPKHRRSKNFCLEIILVILPITGLFIGLANFSERVMPAIGVWVPLLIVAALLLAISLINLYREKNARFAPITIDVVGATMSIVSVLLGSLSFFNALGFSSSDFLLPCALSIIGLFTIILIVGSAIKYYYSMESDIENQPTLIRQERDYRRESQCSDSDSSIQDFRGARQVTTDKRGSDRKARSPSTGSRNSYLTDPFDYERRGSECSSTSSKSSSSAVTAIEVNSSKARMNASTSGRNRDQDVTIINTSSVGNYILLDAPCYEVWQREEHSSINHPYLRRRVRSTAFLDEEYKLGPDSDRASRRQTTVYREKFPKLEITTDLETAELSMLRKSPPPVCDQWGRSLRSSSRLSISLMRLK